MTTYRINQSKLAALTSAVDQSGRDLDREVAAAVNATATKTASLVNKSVRTELSVTAKSVKRGIQKGRRATAAYPNTSVSLHPSRRLPLKDFKPRQTRKGVSYKISKRGKRTTLPSGFISGHLGDHVFVRVGKPRLPIRKPMGPSPWGVFVKQDMAPAVQMQSEQELDKQLDRRIKFNLLKASGEI
ncbi:MAG: phage tail protein [Planctomycetota bacterium]